MSDLHIDYEVTGKVGVVSFTRPPVNAIRYADIQYLNDFFESLPQADELVCVISTGGGKSFIAGHDINEFIDYKESKHEKYTDIYMEFIETLYTFPIPTIAAVDGPAAGAGAIFASLCDLRIASSDASFSLPEINVGIIGGFGPLRRCLPDEVARYMMYTGEPISAERAFELGGVTKLAENPKTAAVELGKSIASKNPDAVKAAREAVLGSQPRWPVEEYRQEREYIADLRAKPNAEKAAQAFLENQEPEFE